MDGKHQAAAEVVVEAAVVAFAHESRLFELRGGETALFEQAQKRAPGAVGESQPELFDGFRLESAANQVGARWLARRAAEIGAEALGREFMHLEDRLAQARLVVGVLRALGNGDAVAIGQFLEGLIEGDCPRFP